MTAERHHVKIGEVRVASAEGVLYTIGLGSCVAVAMYDPKQKVSGLAHVMLPEPNGQANMAPGRFAPTAVEMLLQMMVEAGARERGIFARIAGGAAMFAEVLPTEGVSLGERNVNAVKAALAKAGIPLQAEDCGGSFGRSVFLDADNGSFLVRAVRRDDILL